MSCQEEKCGNLVNKVCRYHNFILCDQHIKEHFLQPGKHELEILNLTLDKKETINFRKSTSKSIVLLNQKKNFYTEIEKRLEATIKIVNIEKVELEKEIKFYNGIYRLDKFSESIKAKKCTNFNENLFIELKNFENVLKSIYSNVEILSKDFDKDKEKISKPSNQEDLKSNLEFKKQKIDEKNRSGEDLKSDLEPKKQEMDGKNICFFMNDFGPGKNFRNKIHDIKFSEDEEFSFVCKLY